MTIVQKIDKKFCEFVLTEDFKDFYFNSPISEQYIYEHKKDRVNYVIDVDEKDYYSMRWRLYVDKDFNIKDDKDFYKVVYLYVFYNNDYKYYSMPREYVR